MKMKKVLQVALLTALVTSLVPTFSQAVEVTYEEQNSNTNMVENFTGSAKVVYGQTPSFTVKIPKNIDLDNEGAGKYTVGVKGQIPSKYTISVIPDETITMKEENGLLDNITADVTPEKTTWTATELTKDTYNESTDNTIQMQGIDYGKFEGTLNFNVSAEADDSIEVGSETDLENFTYSLNDSTNVITLTKYANGTKNEVVIYGKYEVNGKVYDTEITGTVFYNDLNGENNNVITSVVFKPGVKAVGDCGDMFNSCEGLTSVDFSGLDTSEVTSIGVMFSCCTSLTQLDLTSFDTRNVTDMSYMFTGCTSLTQLDLTSFNTSKVTSMAAMFSNCSSLTSIKVSSAIWIEPEDKDDIFTNCGVSSVTKV